MIKEYYKKKRVYKSQKTIKDKKIETIIFFFPIILILYLHLHLYKLYLFVFFSIYLFYYIII